MRKPKRHLSYFSLALSILIGSPALSQVNSSPKSLRPGIQVDIAPFNTNIPGASKDSNENLTQSKIFKTNVPAMSWIDSSQPIKAILLCIHGLSLHKGNFDAFGQRMSKDGFAVFAIDVRGFGDWQKQKETSKVNLKDSLSDITQVLKELQANYPNLPIVILGESMGGAIALHCAAANPALVSGLISSVPAGDRFGQTDEEFKVGIHAILGGFHKEINIGQGVVEKATKKEELRKAWGNDPLVRMKLSPSELMQFQSFMGQNFDCAQEIKTMPVLFIQGMNDKLVRPAGTWKLCEALSTPDRQIVFSKSGEHLILEEGQFSEEDIKFVNTWLARHVLSKEYLSNNQNEDEKKNAIETNSETKIAKQESEKTENTSRTSQKQNNAQIAINDLNKTKISYWIELYRAGKLYRCNNKYRFRSGDSIRFHVTPETDGYGYIIMKQSSSGKQAVLFPGSGEANDLTQKHDYALPPNAWLTFDNHPGVENLSLIFSCQPLEGLLSPQKAKYLTAYISPDQSGSKDLVPTRMQLSWQDPDPIIIPESLPESKTSTANKPLPKSEHIQSHAVDNNSLVIVTCQDPVLAIDIALSHN